MFRGFKERGKRKVTATHPATDFFIYFSPRGTLGAYSYREGEGKGALSLIQLIPWEL